jgi:hypothetical protein
LCIIGHLLEFDVESGENFAKFGNQTFAFLKKITNKRRMLLIIPDISGHLQKKISFFYQFL